MDRQELTRVDVCAKLVDLLSQLRERRAARIEKRLRSHAGVSDALRKLCSGSIGVDDYLEAKLKLAIEPLEQLLRPADLAAVRLLMLERIQTEPIWRSVVEELRAAVSRERSERGDDHDH